MRQEADVLKYRIKVERFAAVPSIEQSTCTRVQLRVFRSRSQDEPTPSCNKAWATCFNWPPASATKNDPLFQLVEAILTERPRAAT
jgi:hypothetical protein